MIAALARLLRRLANTLHLTRANRDLDRELAAHLSLLEDGYRQQGLSNEEARRAARVALGGVAQTQERCRDEASFRGLSDLWRDIGYALRDAPPRPYRHRNGSDLDCRWRCRQQRRSSPLRMPFSSGRQQASHSRSSSSISAAAAMAA